MTQISMGNSVGFSESLLCALSIETMADRDSELGCVDVWMRRVIQVSSGRTSNIVGNVMSRV